MAQTRAGASPDFGILSALQAQHPREVPMIVDALLDLLKSQGADALLLKPDAAPVLLRSDQTIPLSMPPLSLDLLAEIVAELEPGADGHCRYVSGGSTFEVTVEGTEASTKIRFVREQEKPAEAPPPAPAPETAHSSSVPRPAPLLGDHSPADSAPRGELSPAIVRVLMRAQHDDASDIFISAGRPVHIRRGGEVLPLSDTQFGDADLAEFIAAILGNAQRAELEREGNADVSFTDGAGPSAFRYRANVFRQLDGLAVAVRPIRREAPTLVELGLPEDLHRLMQFRNGLVLMTGTAGSGKSTTLVALLERLNRTTAKHIITIEDPIEFRFGQGAGLVHQREVGDHVSGFGVGLRAALREAPDVILVGEMRDRETIAAALTAAETGHLVVSTLHCADAAMAVDRIIDVFPEHQQSQVRYQLAAVLRAVVTQVLLPSTSPPRRVVAFEKLLVNTAVATKIRESRSHQIRSELHPGRSDGMVPLEVTLGQLLARGEITEAVARATAPDPGLLRTSTR